jgi:hypothetical protein
VPKRTFWLITGAAVGAGSSLWVERRVRRTVQQATARLQPDALVTEVGRSARQVAGNAGTRLRDAMTSGRHEMQRREEELWADLAAQGVATSPGIPPVTPASALPPSPPRPPDPPRAPAVSEDERSRPPRPARSSRRRRRTPAKSASRLAK